MSTLPLEELADAFHPSIGDPAEWHPVRYEIDIDESTGLPGALVIAFRSRDGQKKRLKFEQPTFSQFGPLQISSAQNLYVADLTSLGWAAEQHIEVGEWEEERTALFWASSVEEVA